MVDRFTNTHLASHASSLTAAASLATDFIPLLSTIFNEHPDCASVYSVDGALAYANQSLLNTLGCTIEQAQNNPLLSNIKSY